MEPLFRRLAAEALGTALLVAAECVGALLAAAAGAALFGRQLLPRTRLMQVN